MYNHAKMHVYTPWIYPISTVGVKSCVYTFLQSMSAKKLLPDLKLIKIHLPFYTTD